MFAWTTVIHFALNKRGVLPGLSDRYHVIILGGKESGKATEKRKGKENVSEVRILEREKKCKENQMRGKRNEQRGRMNTKESQREIDLLAV